MHCELNLCQALFSPCIVLYLLTGVLLLQSGQIRQMEEVKISKKSKVGILQFVTCFEEFAKLAEAIFRNAERRGDLDKAYSKLIRAVFHNGVCVLTKLHKQMSCMHEMP